MNVQCEGREWDGTDVTSVDPVIVYGDFNCPWSYLAFRRAAVLAAAGAVIDWRAVEHAPWLRTRTADGSLRVAALQEEIERVLSLLLPGEEYPYDLAGFVPTTKAAVAAYAEATAAGVPDVVRRVLFEGFWMHGIDIGNARLLRALLADELRGSESPCEAVRDWGYSVDVTGGHLSNTAWRSTRAWDQAWSATGKEVVPALVLPGQRVLHGVDAVEWLGQEIVHRGLELGLPPSPGEDPPDCRELPSLMWVSENGGSWLERCQLHASASLRPTG